LISEKNPSGRGTPTVNIILPTSTRSRLIERAARSVLAQSSGDLELLVVDDASAEGRRCLRRAIGVHPGHLKAWVAPVLSLFGSEAYHFADNLRKWVGRRA
jgi:glycosyltransferase involved in cell wall biosynthesis